jgi:hypothetical protein
MQRERRRRGLQDRVREEPLLKGRADGFAARGRRSTVGDLVWVADGSSFASAASPSCAEATEWHQAIATSMGLGLSSRVEVEDWE